MGNIKNIYCRTVENGLRKFFKNLIFSRLNVFDEVRLTKRDVE